MKKKRRLYSGQLKLVQTVEPYYKWQTNYFTVDLAVNRSLFFFLENFNFMRIWSRYISRVSCGYRFQRTVWSNKSRLCDDKFDIPRWQSLFEQMKRPKWSRACVFCVWNQRNSNFIYSSVRPSTRIVCTIGLNSFACTHTHSATTNIRMRSTQFVHVIPISQRFR